MMKNMGKEIAGGIIFLGGVALAATTIETMPIVAGIGAAASLGAGIYQAVSAAHQTKLAQVSETPHLPSTRAS